MLTSSRWGVVIFPNIYHICSSAALSLAVAVVVTLLLLGAFIFLMASGPLLLLQCGCQWPIRPHLEHMESLAGQEDLPGTCDFVQLLQACWAILVVWDFCCWGCCHWYCCFWWQIALTVFEPVRHIAFMLSEMAMCMWHNSSISEIVAFNFRARSLQMRSESNRAQTKQYCIFLSFPSSEGKPQWSLRPWMHSANSLGVSPGHMWTSSSWKILHHWDMGWSIVEEKYSRNAAALFFLFLQSASLSPSGFHCSCFHWPVVPRKLSKYLSKVPSSGSSFIPWRQYQLSIDLQKRQKSSYCSVVCQLNVGGFNASASELDLRAPRALARAASGLGPDMTTEIRRHQHAYGALIQLVMGQVISINSGVIHRGPGLFQFQRGH